MIDPTVTAAFKPLSLDELFSLELPELEFVVDGILPLGSACLLNAREKAGKGLLAIDLCASVALGEPFLEQAVLEGAAIYCAAEENIREVRDRIGARVGDRRDAPLYVLPLDGSTDDRLRLDDPFSMQRLWDMVEEIQPVLAVLDTLRELHERQEDHSDEMAPLLRPVRQLAHQTNTAVVVNHHQNRAGTFRGSTAIRAAFDLEWAFSRTVGDAEREEEPLRGTMKVEGRHGPRKIINVRLGQGLRWELDQPVIMEQERGTRERLLAHLAAVNTWPTAREIAEASGIKLKTVQNVLAEIMKETSCPIVVQGGGTKNDSRRYCASSPCMDGIRADTPSKMIPPAPVAFGGSVGGNHFGPNGAAGNDR
jgi:hypothetical protein